VDQFEIKISKANEGALNAQTGNVPRRPNR